MYCYRFLHVRNNIRNMLDATLKLHSHFLLSSHHTTPHQTFHTTPNRTSMHTKLIITQSFYCFFIFISHLLHSILTFCSSCPPIFTSIIFLLFSSLLSTLLHLPPPLLLLSSSSYSLLIFFLHILLFFLLPSLSSLSPSSFSLLFLLTFLPSGLLQETHREVNNIKHCELTFNLNNTECK